MSGKAKAVELPKLLCCLMGFEDNSSQTLRRLAQLFRPSLTAEWEFTEGWQEGCVLLLCDLDDGPTRALWRDGSLSDMPLAFATSSATETFDGPVIRKPLRGQGPHGLVQMLNNAAAARRGPDETSRAGAEPDAAGARVLPFPAAAPARSWSEPTPSPTALHPAVAAPELAPLLGDEPIVLEPSARIDLPAPAEGEPDSPAGAAAEPADDSGLPIASSSFIDDALLNFERELRGGQAGLEPPASPTPEPPQDPEYAPGPRAEDGFAGALRYADTGANDAVPPAAGCQDAQAAAPEPPPLPGSIFGDLHAAPADGTDADPAAGTGQDETWPPAGTADPEPGVVFNTVPVSDAPSSYGSPKSHSLRPEVRKKDEDAALRSILRGLGSQPEPAATTAPDDFLALLNRLHWLRSVAIIELEGLAPICVTPVEGLYYARATLAEVNDVLSSRPVPRHVKVAPSLREARTQIGCLDVEPGSLRELFWLGNVRCPNEDQFSRFATGAYRLRRWPDLAQLPHERKHVAWCGLLARRPVTLDALRGLTEAEPGELAAFLAACAALSILEQVEVTAEAEVAIAAPQTAKSRERVSIFRSLLNRLGFRRS